MTKAARAYAGRLPHYVNRITEAWENTTAEDRAKGAEWFDRAQAAAAGLHYNSLIGAGVIAALSPRCPWATNLEWAKKVCDRALSRSRIPPSVSTYVNRQKAWYIARLMGPTPETIQSILKPNKRYGYKIERFFRNIIGDSQAVTIDTWAARVAEGGVFQQDHINGIRYESIERAYQITAERLGRTPRELQAAIWISVRGSEL